MKKVKRNSNIVSDPARIRRFLFAAAAALILTGCAAQPRPAAPAEETGAEVSGTPALEETPSDKTDAAAESTSEKQTGEAESPASVKEEEKVTLVIPTVYENISTQEEADEIRARNGYESATLEEDGSLTIVMSRSQYDELLRGFRESVDRGIAEIISEDYGSSIEKIEYNDDYSVFTVTVTSDEIGIVERQTADELVMYGTLYHIYTAGEADHIQVDYVNRDSGEVIESADSGSLDNAY
ncbi:MAG: hypothetical protein K6G34_14465 [Lachnospiraceae bacterium]|nr:hypothetical protein [Lachnospiraceae bacterium]